MGMCSHPARIGGSTRAIFLFLVTFGTVWVPAKITPMPLVSSGKPCFASTGNVAALFDRDLTTNWDGGVNTWVAVKVGGGYSKLLLHWIPAEYSTWIPYWDATDSTGSPGDYQILVSANSTNGQDGAWDTVVSVTGSHYVGRMHSFAFTGMQWVKMQITAQAWAKNPISLAELEIFDASNGADDTWFFMGNSITSGAFPIRITPNFSQDIAAAHPGYTPAMIDGGWSGARTTEGLTQIDDRLTVNPDVKYWCLEYGTNDSRDKIDTLVFKANLDTMITKIMAAGHVPMLAQVPWSVQNYSVTPAYSRMIDSLNAKYGLLPGPDLFTWFKNHPTELKTNDVHPNDTGDVSMNRLWAQAVSSLYQTTTAVAGAGTTTRTHAPGIRVFDGPGRSLCLVPAHDGVVVISRPNGARLISASVAAGQTVRFSNLTGTMIVRLVSDHGVESLMAVGR